MRIDAGRALHLTYCTNIHPADGWPAVFAALSRYAPALKRRLSPDQPFGIGLRLSARDARELLEPGRLDALAEALDREGLYVAIINGFPYGPFHGTPVKATVYAPDWQDDERVRYTLDLVDILGRILPAGVDGGISTAPLTYKAWMPGGAGRDAAWALMTRNVVRVAERMARLARDRGMQMHLDIEPEPDCLIERTDEAIAFFDEWLLPRGTESLAASLGVSRGEAEQAIRDHVRVCFDCCHAAVEYEDPLDALGRLAGAGIQIGRVQLSSALRVAFPSRPADAALVAERLRPFTNSTYLHQVIAAHDGVTRHFPDLDEAIAGGAPAGGEWRIHFHVPLFTAEYDGLQSTQDYVATVLRHARRHPFTSHLEIETYTWDVLPPALRIDVLDSIGREYDWVLQAFHA